jgi:hypothetical protein
MRYLRVLWSLALLPVLLFAQSAEAARISFATENCGTPDLLGLEFGIDSTGTSVLLNTADGCPTFPNSVIAGEIAADGTLYGTSITNIDLTIDSDQSLTTAQFTSGNFFDLDSPFSVSFSFAPFTGGGGVLSITFEDPIQLCFFGDTGTFCPDLDLLIHIDGGGEGVALSPGTIVQVTAVNDQVLPEPATLSLLGVGLAVAAVRRRRITATKASTSRASSAPDIAHRT